MDEETLDSPSYADDEMVRVSIICQSDPVLAVMNYETDDLANNSQAMSYQEQVQQEQAVVQAFIEEDVLDGEELDVVWNLTLVANAISANIEYGQIEAIEALPGVASVELETRYEPQVLDETFPADPNMATSGSMIGSTSAWANGYTGAGMRIAVIDTGLSIDHKSFNSDAFEYSLSQLAETAEMSTDAYVKSLDLLDAEEIASVLDKLHVLEDYDCTADDLYISSKIPFGFNYIDNSLDVTHKNDTQGNHGSHVSGTATANAYVKNSDGTYSDALSSTYVRGVAPDAQILVMKVFGKMGGAYDSDYMVAIEDAVMLGCDAVNLSLGSAYAGFVRSARYNEIMESLTAHGTVVCISAGNAGHSMDNSHALPGYLYAEDVSANTVGSPGSYANALTVASADNDGGTGHFLVVDGKGYFFNEPSSYSNKPIATIAGTHSFLMIDSIGTEEEFASVADQLEGKIAICHRGTVSFAEKAESAVSHGAIATIIVNNSPTMLGMDLSAYTHTEPVVLAPMDMASTLRQAGEAHTTAGGLTYYVGTIKINGSIEVVSNNSDYYTMSSFSSWGVPGNLTLKPEITAPGGSIYSVSGKDNTNADFEVMSGTSMASPQVAGMSALVAQMVQEKGLVEKSGYSARQIIQSLLMSTAHPMTEEESMSLYPVLRQGAGLANVGDAVSASSFIMMDEDASASAEDGKVKVELGDDPDRVGEYSWTFTIHNFSDTAKSYTLSTDLLTQDVFDYYGFSWMDTWTTALSADVTYSVGGATFVPSAPFSADVNRDGDTDATDASLALQVAVGTHDGTGLDLTAADVDGDGSVTSYDAHLILRDMRTEAFSVASNDSVTVTVNVKLTAEQKAYLDANYENGAYIEGYTYVNPVTTAEGAVTDVQHSIPILGFYGNWSDPSMFDKQSLVKYYSGDNTPPYTSVVNTNGLVTVMDGDTTGYYMMGNPYFLEDTVHTERNAMNSRSLLYLYSFTLIRNASAVFTKVEDQDGNLLYRTAIANQVPPAFYYSSDQAWAYTIGSVTMDKRPYRIGAEEGDVLTVSFYALPEYYETYGAMTDEEVDALIASGTLGDGVMMSTTVTIDDTAPELVAASKDLLHDDQLTITAKDNNYVAYMGILNEYGARIFEEDLPSEHAKGGEASCTFDLSEHPVGEYITVILGDYAGNESSYKVYYGGEGIDSTNKMYAFTNGDKTHGEGSRWVELDPNTVFTYWDSTTMTGEYGGMENVLYTDLKDVLYGEYANGYVYMVTEELNMNTRKTDTTLWVAPHDQPSLYQQVAVWEDLHVFGMSYNYADKQMYILSSSGASSTSDPSVGVNTIYTFDLSTGALTEQYTVTLSVPGASHTNYPLTDYKWEQLHTLAISKDGTFYSLKYGDAPTNQYDYAQTLLYSWSADDVQNGKIEALEPVSTSSIGFSCMYGSMAWDHDNNKLYCAACKSSGPDKNNLLIEIDPETGVGSRCTVYDGGHAPECASRLYTNVRALYVVPSFAGSMPFAETATEVWLDTDEISILQGSEYKITSAVYPWNLKDTSVVWSTADASIATVDQNGIITAVGVGDTIVTATASAGSNVSHDVKVHVDEVPSYDVHALTYDTDSKPQWVSFNTADPSQYTVLHSSDRSYLSGSDYQNSLLLHDGKAAYLVDPKTYTSTLVTAELPESLIWSDSAFSPSVGYKPSEGFSDEGIAVLSAGGTYLTLLSIKDGKPAYTFPFSLSILLEDNDKLGAIAFTKQTQTSSGFGMFALKATLNNYYYVSESGGLYFGSIQKIQMGMGIQPLSGTAHKVGDLDLRLGDVSDPTSDQSCSMLYDEATGYLILSTYYLDNLNEIYIIDPVNCNCVRVGDFGKDVWPTVALHWAFDDTAATTAHAEAAAQQIDALAQISAESENYVTAEALSMEEAAALFAEESASKKANGSTNVVSGAPIVTRPEHQAVYVDASAKTVTVNVSASASTNGKYTLDYDTSVLTFVSANANGELNAFNTSTAGTVVGAYANTSAASYGARVTFSYEGSLTKETTLLTLTTLEDGSKKPMSTETLVANLPSDASVIPPVVWGILDEADDDFPFTDVAWNDEYYDAVSYLYNNGIMNGMSATKFAPDAELTRGMVVTILYRMTGEPAASSTTSFSDVASNRYYSKAVAWAAQNGIVNGFTDGTFQPDANVTREQLAAIIRRYAMSQGVFIAEPTNTLASTSVVSNWAKTDVAWAAAEGILSDAQTSNTTKNATRAEVAMAIYTYLMKTAR